CQRNHVALRHDTKSSISLWHKTWVLRPPAGLHPESIVFSEKGKIVAENAVVVIRVQGGIAAHGPGLRYPRTSSICVKRVYLVEAEHLLQSDAGRPDAVADIFPRLRQVKHTREGYAHVRVWLVPGCGRVDRRRVIDDAHAHVIGHAVDRRHRHANQATV